MRPALRPLLPALLSACVLLAATDAVACRTRVPRPAELAQKAIVMATVTQADRVDVVGWNTWRIVAEADGAAARSTFTFTTTLSSDGCGRTPLPPAGERWVLYVDQARPGEVLDAFPLDFAKEYDPRLADIR